VVEASAELKSGQPGNEDLGFVSDQIKYAIPASTVSLQKLPSSNLRRGVLNINNYSRPSG
jgi:hypothetical protein